MTLAWAWLIMARACSSCPSINPATHCVNPRTRADDLVMSSCPSRLSYFINDDLDKLRMTSVEAYSLCALRTPAAPHTHHKPFSPDPTLTLACMWIAQVVVI
jgi:hypothetical protein